MLVVHKFEACGRCRGATMWRLKNCDLFCERCQRRKDVPRRRPFPVHLAALFGLLVIVAAWVAFAFGESDSPFEISASSGQPGLEKRLESARHSEGPLTLHVSMREFVELQRLDDNGRRLLLGLPEHCNPGITAMMAPTSTVGRLVALITCTANLHR